MIDYTESETYKILVDYDWDISEGILWAFFVTAFKAENFQEFCTAMDGLINEFELDEFTREALGKAVITDLKESLK